MNVSYYVQYIIKCFGPYILSFVPFLLLPLYGMFPKCRKINFIEFVPSSQRGAEWPGHRAPGLQSYCGAQRQPALHRHSGGFIPTGEVGMDKRHQPGTCL